MKIEFLANRSDAIPIIGRWYNLEWGRRFQDETEEQSIEKLNQYLNTDRIPLILVATDGTEILGAAQLKYREMKDIFPEKEHWLGGVFVAPEQRGCGIGEQLVQEIVILASSYGVCTLHLQSEQLDGGLYRKLGWLPVQQVDNHGIRVVVMERQVGA